MLPGIDDGAPDLTCALEMARMAVRDGITITACTPHILPGLYENTASSIRNGVAALQTELDEAGIRLKLVVGADVHLTPDLLAGLRSGRIPTLNDSRYFLFEPPHHVAPPRMEEKIFHVMAAGYVPLITHPERLTWIESHYEIFQRLASAGAWMQVTAGALTGAFGPRPVYWSERMLEEGLVHVLASDAHGIRRRAPGLAKAHDCAARRVGADEALHLVLTRPAGILRNATPADLPLVPLRASRGKPYPQPAQTGLLGRALSRIVR
jgi:protein-tyrosine phosphatase